MTGLRIDVADLLAHAGSRRAVDLAAELEGLSGSAVRIRGPVALALDLERIPEGIIVRGDLGCSWAAECSTCLTDVHRDLVVHVDELFEADPVDGETYPIDGHEIDLELLARDAVLLELPLAPRCEAPCRADAAEVLAADEPSLTVTDPRWAALSELEMT